MTLNIRCPSCMNALELPDEAMGNKANCVICKNVFVVNDSDVWQGDRQDTSESSSGPDTKGKTVLQTTDRGTMELLLATIEEGLKRMIVGIPRFFVASIENICCFLMDSMPVMIRGDRLRRATRRTAETLLPKAA